MPSEPAITEVLCDETYKSRLGRIAIERLDLPPYQFWGTIFLIFHYFRACQK
jgi:hypothetical protein